MCIRDRNDGGRFQGHADIPLNDAGREQAEDAGRVLARMGITAVHCSDLSRARETASIVGGSMGLQPVAEPRLREVDVGTWSGLSMDEVGRMEPDFWPALREGRDFRRSPAGETATESGRRVALMLLDFVEAARPDDVLLVVGHGLSLRVASLLLMGLDYSHARLFGGLRNCHWAVLQPGAEHWRMLSYNESADR